MNKFIFKKNINKGKNKDKNKSNIYILNNF